MYIGTQMNARNIAHTGAGLQGALLFQQWTSYLCKSDWGHRFYSRLQGVGRSLVWTSQLMQRQCRREPAWTVLECLRDKTWNNDPFILKKKCSICYYTIRFCPWYQLLLLNFSAIKLYMLQNSQRLTWCALVDCTT